MTFGEHLAETVNHALTHGVAAPEVIFSLDMMSHELKARLLVSAQKDADKLANGEQPKTPLIIQPPEFGDRAHD